MAQQTSITIQGPKGEQVINLTEANPAQRIESYNLATDAFGGALNKTEVHEREKILSEHPLTKGSKWRFWCLTLADDPTDVLATLRLFHRDLLIKDAKGVREEQGYCISMVVTREDYRGKGLASFMLQNVAKWMDGPGNTAVSLLYCSLTKWYTSQGWPQVRVWSSELPALPKASLKIPDNFPTTRPILREELSQLCERDVQTIKGKFNQLSPDADQVYVAVLPAGELIDWIQERCTFSSKKIHGKIPTNRGAICESANVWLYWAHDFRKNQLFIQRIAEPAEESAESRQALAKLLLDACNEAKEWDLPKVTVWNASAGVQRSIDVLNKEFGLDVKTVDRVDDDCSSYRLRGRDESKKVDILINEGYAWS